MLPPVNIAFAGPWFTLQPAFAFGASAFLSRPLVFPSMAGHGFRIPAIFAASAEPSVAEGVPVPASGGTQVSDAKEKRTAKAELPPKTPPIAKAEKGKMAALINRVDVGLDDYDDIFSDFDPSPYTSRLISTDFISEIMRRYRETKEGQIEVRFSIPEKMRNSGVENVIRTRLKEYFKAQAEKVEAELQKKERRGYAMGICGLGLITLHRLLTDNITGGTAHDIYRWFENPMELFGWIATWTSFDRLYLHRPEESIEKQDAFARFSRANFIFISAETLKKGMEKPA